MAHFSLRNRETGITLDAHEFAPEERYALYQHYAIGARIVCGTAQWIVKTVCWDRIRQEFIVGAQFDTQVPTPEELWC